MERLELRRRGVRDRIPREYLERERDEVLLRGADECRRRAVAVLVDYAGTGTVLFRIPRIEESTALLVDWLGAVRRQPGHAHVPDPVPDVRQEAPEALQPPTVAVQVSVGSNANVRAGENAFVLIVDYAVVPARDSTIVRTGASAYAKPL